MCLWHFKVFKNKVKYNVHCFQRINAIFFSKDTLFLLGDMSADIIQDVVKPYDYRELLVYKVQINT